MLQEIRDRAQGWFAWAIVILISLPFALWGIHEYLGGGAEPIIAKVNGEKITQRELDQRSQQFQRELQQRLGTAFNPELLDEERLRKEVLERMVQSILILQEAANLGLYASDNQVRGTILNIPTFQANGQFDHGLYERAIRYQGIAGPAQFEQQIRRSLLAAQMEQAITSTAIVSDHELSEILRLREQQREVSLLVIPAQGFMNQAQATEDELKTYYEGHKDAFYTAERIKLDYVVLDAETLGEKLNPSDQELQAYLEQHEEEFAEPEQRQASHILIAVPENAEAARVDQARAKIETAVARIKSGESFSEVARTLSEDPGSAASGGDLGYFRRGMMDPAFEEAAFGTEVGKLSEPVRSRFGFHLILVTEVKPGGKPSLATAREPILASYRRREGEQQLYDQAEKAADLAYEHPDSLESLSTTLSLKIQTSDWIGRGGGEGLLSAPKVLAAAFGDDVLIDGHNSEVIELSPERMMVLRVREHEEARLQPLEEVKESVTKRLQAERARAQAEQKGQELVAKLKEGVRLERLQQETGFSLQTPGAIKRDYASLSPSLVAYIFKLPKPQDNQPVYGGQALENGDYALVSLTSVQDGHLAGLDEGTKSKEKGSLRRQLGQGYYHHLTALLRSKADVTTFAP